MESLVGYGSDEDIETERYSGYTNSVAYGAGSSRGRDDDNYDTVNMDMSEESGESEPELPPARPEQSKSSTRDDRRHGDSSKEDGPRERDVDRHRDRRDRDARDRRHSGSDRGDRRGDNGPREPSRRGLLGDKPDEKTRPDDKHHEKSSSSESKSHGVRSSSHSRDAHDAVSHRFIDRRDRDKDRDRDRDRDNRDRHGRKSHDRGDRSGRGDRHRSRSRPGNNYQMPDHLASSSGDHRGPSGSEYRPSSYKVNKKLQVMEKMGLQIKTPDGCMKTAQQLREDSGECVSQSVPAGSRPNYYNPAGTAANVLEQVKKRKLLWSKAGKCENEEAGKWSGTRFAADQDGKQVNKFMRLMGIKDPAAVSKPDEAKEVDPIKKQEELFQAMQAQYEVARATTHTMRGVGLGFQRGQF